MLESSRRPVVIVTGASRGLGAATAEQLALAGADVVLAARTEEGLQATAETVRAAGGRALVVSTDVTDEAACRRLIDRTLAEFGRLNSLINNAGVLEPMGRLAEVDTAAFRRAFDVNVYGVLYTTQAALPPLRATGGRIINVSTGVAVAPHEGWGAYCASKAAAWMLTQITAREEPGVVTVAFQPGVVDTEMQALIRQKGQAAMPPERYQYFVRLKREGQLLAPEEPGRALAWLALYAPAELSGEMIRVGDERLAAGVQSLFG